MSYFLSERAVVIKGLQLGNLIALFHSGSATVLVLVTYFVLRRTAAGKL